MALQEDLLKRTIFERIELSQRLLACIGLLQEIDIDVRHKEAALWIVQSCMDNVQRLEADVSKSMMYRYLSHEIDELRRWIYMMARTQKMQSIPLLLRYHIYDDDTDKTQALPITNDTRKYRLNGKSA